ncbi:MAG: ShlB/FhaC/HecB family hemolysin secretion/activation protein [Desulfobacteraceae bacterium]|nr:ShlB/FhaC/HecB family hemolysin secretion/activation protein [Desulfobacteraceae bacterium]
MTATGVLEKWRPLKGFCLWGLFLAVLITENVLAFSLPRIDPLHGNLSAMDSLFVNKIVLSGNTVFSDAELGKVTGAYENRAVSAEMLQSLRLALTRMYVDQGYVNSGVVIPDQRIKEGVVRLSVIEGKLGGTSITGNHMLRDGYIKDRLDRAILTGDTPLNVFVLQRNLKLLKDDPHINVLHGRVVPGKRKGEAFLHLEVEESPRHSVVLDLNNHGSPGTGSTGGELSMNYRSLLGMGDDLYAAYLKTEGVDSCRLKYTLPVNRLQTSLTAEIDRSRTRVVAEPFSFLDITGESGGESLFLNHPFYRSLSTDFSAGLKIERRFSRTFYQGRDFSHGDGAVDGESRVLVLRFIQQWRHRTLDQAAGFDSTFSFGVDGPGATFSGKEPDARFFSWFGQFQWIKRLSFADSQVSVRLLAQLADDPLLSMEKFVMGGARTVRGYREDSLSGDQGAAASLEWQVPVGRFRIPGISTASTDGILSIVPFFDWAIADNRKKGADDPGNLCSVGIGARWKAGKRLHAEVFWGKPLTSIERVGDHDLQDEGIHFRITMELF